jgi:hypothetical protein
MAFNIRKYNDISMAYNENNIKLMAAGYKLKKQWKWSIS